MIAEQSREGWFRSGILAGLLSGTTPALRATPPDSGGEPLASVLNSFTPSQTQSAPAVGSDLSNTARLWIPSVIRIRQFLVI